nr:MAG TPA: hypothetical protein [Caudoviricetes sp.]
MAPVARWVLFYCKNTIFLCINILTYGRPYDIIYNVRR